SGTRGERAYDLFSRLLRIEASHTLEHFFNNVARSVSDPNSHKPLWDGMQAAALRRTNASAKQAIQARPDLRLGALGSGSDWAAFLDHLGIASADLRFSGAGGGVYHSTYDDFYWFTHFSDTKFVYERALAQTMGTAVIRMADAPILPFEFSDFADTMHLYLQQIETLRQDSAGAPALDFVPLASAVQSLQTNAADYDRAVERAEASGRIFQDAAALAQLNRILYSTERAMMVSGGLPGRPWYKHAIYAPGTYTGYGVKTLPGLREAIEQKRWSEAAGQIGVLQAVMQKVTNAIASATRVLGQHD
ncbi:MAG: transferrin receptor-like dimerization domain-containing protein, partial [Terriglobales bacterium]